jgi:hypothetical protein
MTEIPRSLPPEEQLRSLLSDSEESGKRAKGLLLEIIENLPVEVKNSLFKNTCYILELDLRNGSMVALLPDGIFKIPYVLEPLQGPAWDKRQDIKPQEYLVFGSEVLDRINYELVCYKMQQEATAST